MAVTRPLRLLQVAQRFAAQPTSGAELRVYHLGTRLAGHMPVTHIGFSPESEPCPAAPPGCAVEFMHVPRGGSYRLADLFLGALGKAPFSVLNYTRESMKSALAALLDKEYFDVVQLEGVHLGGYLPVLRNARRRPGIIACDWHNIESELLYRYSGGAGSLLRKIYAGRAARQLEAYERWFVNQCDLHIVVSDRDREALERYGTRVPILFIDNGVDLESFAACPPPASRAAAPAAFRVLYVGSMDYHANVDAVSHFASEVWPGVRRALPDAVFTVAGRNPPAEIRTLSGKDGVEVTGTVADIRPYYRDASVMVVPIRVAGGTRIKILEAMAAGVPVVSTARGAEGLAAVPGTHYLLADTAAGMCAAILDLERDPGVGGRLAEAGRELVRQRYDWAVLGDQLAACYARLMDGTSGAAETAGGSSNSAARASTHTRLTNV